MSDIYTDPYTVFPQLHENELRGTEGIEVEIINSTSDPYSGIMTGQSASWRPWRLNFTESELLETLKKMEAGQLWAGQAFESISFTFAIRNITRACTHQLVRIRIGAGFMQESGREGVWHKAPFRTPLTILEDEYAHRKFVEGYIHDMDLYTELISRGIPPQDARFSAGHYVCQNMWMTINFAALMNWCSKRLCCTMQWEINTLARKIRDAVLSKYPHLGVMLKSNCERSGGCKSITDFYKLGAQDNGNKVYFKYEGRLCGKAGLYSEEQISALCRAEIKQLQMP